jgi:kynurenine formamidase
MDMPRLKGVDYLEPGTRIYPEDLEAWEKKAGIRVSAGDALFIRTGRWTRMKKNPSAGRVREAGLDASVIPWLKQRDIALLGGEMPHDAPQQGDMPSLPVHDFALISLGVHLLDNCSLDEVAEAAAARNQWEFMLVVAPLRVPGGTGSPVSPIATF